jgi:uncharacterized protein with FMN-binding domain
MRRIILWLLATIAALVLLFSYRTSTMGVGGDPTATAGAAPRPAATGAGGDGDAGDAGTGTGSTGDSSSGGTAAGGSYDGSVAQTRWGPIQVRITVAGGKITDVSALTYPDGNHRDEEINAYALPILHDEVVQAQSADIDTVSGATVTTDGYRESLQAAIDAAHL